MKIINGSDTLPKILHRGSALFRADFLDVNLGLYQTIL